MRVTCCRRYFLQALPQRCQFAIQRNQPHAVLRREIRYQMPRYDQCFLICDGNVLACLDRRKGWPQSYPRHQPVDYQIHFRIRRQREESVRTV